LLCAELPDWMKLHFQLDPETGWDSPQVRRTETGPGQLSEIFYQITEALT
jgi:hypothetical protein